MSAEAPQRDDNLREVFNGLRRIVRAGAPWRMMPIDLPPWEMVYQQAQRWIKAGVFEAQVHDLRALLRLAQGHQNQPTDIFDSRTIQSSPQSGKRAGYDGAKRKRIDCITRSRDAGMDRLACSSAAVMVSWS